MKNSTSISIIVAWVIVVGLVYAVTITAQPRETRKPYSVYQSGGNCVYIVDGKYANFIAVVPVGQGGC
jgi:cbb3-type cytochrome oxidase cytochrome c subunit